MVNDIFKENGIDLPSIEQADASENPRAIARFSNGKFEWFIIGGKPLNDGDYYLYCLANVFEKELGFVTLKQILDVGGALDSDFKPIGVFDIFEDFDLRKIK